MPWGSRTKCEVDQVLSGQAYGKELSADYGIDRMLILTCRQQLSACIMEQGMTDYGPDLHEQHEHLMNFTIAFTEHA